MPSDDINALHNVFPNIPYDIIETILESNLGDVDKAFDSLLQMSDPDYKREADSTSNNTTAARPSLRKPRVSFQEPIDNTVKPTINHWTADPNAYLRSSSEEEEQIKKDAELARRLAAEQQPSSPQPSTSSPMAANTSWPNPRVPPPPLFGTPPPARPYSSPPNPYPSGAYSTHPRPAPDPFNVQGLSAEIRNFSMEIKDQMPAIRQNVVEQGNLAKQKAKELYQQLKTKNMARHTELGNGNPNPTYRRQSNNPFIPPPPPHAMPPTPNLPPRPPSNRSSTSGDQIRADEEYARRISSQQYRESQSHARVNSSSNQRVESSSEAIQGGVNPFQDEFAEDDRDPPPYESHRNDRLVPQ
ncbi:hypothetical protein Unana1_08064 [Umbelopsis nana]